MARRIAFFRREGRLEEALSLGELLLAQTCGRDREVCNQLFWVLYDIAKARGESTDDESRGSILSLVERMQSFMHFFSADGMHARALDTLRRMAATSAVLNTAIRLSHEAGRQAEACRHAIALIPDTPADAHEEIGWIIYRFLKSATPSSKPDTPVTAPGTSSPTADTSVTAPGTSSPTAGSSEIPLLCRQALAAYLTLQNPRPSTLHSYILWRAVRQGLLDPEFDYPAFLFKWDPGMLRPEDFTPPEPTTAPGVNPAPGISLADHAVRMAARCGVTSLMRRLTDALKSSPMSPSAIAAHFRASAYFAALDALRERRMESFLAIIEKYRVELTPFGPDKYHSLMLSLAVRNIPATQHHRFLSFIKSWDLDNLMEQDWQSVTGHDGRTYDGTAARVMRRLSKILRSLTRTELRDWEDYLAPFFEIAATHLRHDQWFMRDYARWLIRRGRREEAWKIGCSLQRRLGNRFFYWSGMAECATDPDARVTLLCRAITLQRNLSLTRRLHLDLAGMLAHLKMMAEARTELDYYFKGIRPGQRNSTQALGLYDMLRHQSPTSDGNAALYAARSPRATLLLQGPCPL